MKDRSVECGLATYVQCEFRHPATKTQDPREVHDHDRNITGKDTNPFSEGRETQLYPLWPENFNCQIALSQIPIKCSDRYLS